MTQPVAVILTAVLHFVTADDDPGGIAATFIRAMTPGSQLVLSHAASDHIAAGAVADATRIYATAAAPFVPRGQAEIAGFFDGLELMAPGVVSGGTWRPGYLATDPRRTTSYAGLATRR
jgi:S-adenosyl methyltransferase